MTDSTKARSRLPHWGWFLLATVMLVVGYVGLSVWVPWHRERQAIAKIKAMGGRVFVYSTRFNGTSGNFGDLIKLPFLRAGTIEFNGCHHVTDESLRCLADFPNIAALSLTDTPVTDEGLSYVAGLSNLQALCIDGTNVTDKGLEHLGGMASLKKLSLFRTHVSGEALRTFRRRLPTCTIWN
jgi:hypothetical protein